MSDILGLRVDDEHHWRDAAQRLDHILRAITELGVSMAKTFAEIKAELQQNLDANLKAVEANTSISQGLVTLIQGVTAQNAAIKQQLLDAIAAGGDPATLQPIVDALAAQNMVLEASNAKAAAALVANTPAA